MKTSLSIGNIIAFLFGLLFASAGLLFAYLSSGSMAINAIKSQQWIVVPATIETLDFSSNHGEATTYKVKANYSYNYCLLYTSPSPRDS